MAALAISFRPDVLAWADVPDDDARYRRILHTVLAVVAVLCLVLLFSPKPVVDRAKPPELPRWSEPKRDSLVPPAAEPNAPVQAAGEQRRHAQQL